MFEGVDDFYQAVGNEIAYEDQGEDAQAEQGFGKHHAATKNCQQTTEESEDRPAGTEALEGVQDLKKTTDQHCRPDKILDGDAGEKRRADGEHAQENRQDPEGHHPAGSFFEGVCRIGGFSELRHPNTGSVCRVIVQNCLAHFWGIAIVMAMVVNMKQAEDAAAGLNLNRVLLVDDNPTNLQVLYQALEEQGFELLIAQNGHEALEIAAAAKPALILLDINMPEMDGFETCGRLQADEATREIAVIFLSARDQVQDKVKGLQLGAVDYVSKPFQFEEVVARVNTQLELKRAREELKAMHQKTDSLLLNILPHSIADRLKESERNIVDNFPEATILFCDLVGFTPMASRTSPSQLVGFLNGIFSGIDQLVEKYGLEKIKTIGDAYMVAGGVPDPRRDHASAMADFALELLDILPRLAEGAERPVQLRIGIHCGPVVAGVIGEKKFAYDLWGDTVNIASRMESSGSANRIQVSQAARDELGEDYEFESRGTVGIKGKGEMQTWFLLDKKGGAL